MTLVGVYGNSVSLYRFGDMHTNQKSRTKNRKERVRVHLPRLRTDTQDTEKQDKHQKMRRTSAPVTSTDRYTGRRSKANWSNQVRDMQNMEDPKDRTLPEQKGPQPTLAGGPKEKTASDKPVPMLQNVKL